jgi:hypothetical protein
VVAITVGGLVLAWPALGRAVTEVADAVRYRDAWRVAYAYADAVQHRDDAAIAALVGSGSVAATRCAVASGPPATWQFTSPPLVAFLGVVGDYVVFFVYSRDGWRYREPTGVEIFVTRTAPRVYMIIRHPTSPKALACSATAP